MALVVSQIIGVEGLRYPYVVSDAVSIHELRIKPSSAELIVQASMPTDKLLGIAWDVIPGFDAYVTMIDSKYSRVSEYLIEKSPSGQDEGVVKLPATIRRFRFTGDDNETMRVRFSRDVEIDDPRYYSPKRLWVPIIAVIGDTEENVMTRLQVAQFEFSIYFCLLAHVITSLQSLI